MCIYIYIYIGAIDRQVDAPCASQRSSARIQQELRVESLRAQGGIVTKVCPWPSRCLYRRTRVAE